MKKFKSLILAVIMLAISIASAIGLAACGGGGVDIAFCMSQSNELNEAIEDALQEAFPGQKVRSENANSNSTTQTDQVNNFITMGVKMLVVSPVSLEALQAPLNEARAAGIKVVVSGATTQGVDCYDAVTVSDEFLLGSYIAMLGKNWAEENMQGKTFDTVICYNNDFEDNINRSNGIRTITSAKLKNKSGQWIDANGNVVSSEAQAADNPAYCEMLTTGGNHVYEYAMTPNQTMSEYMPSMLEGMVREFIKKNKALWKGKKIFCVATMGLFSGDGAGCTARLLKKYGAIILGGLHIKMPDSVCDNKALKKTIEQNKAIVKQADVKIELAGRQIREGNYPKDGLSFFSHIAGLFGQRLWFYRKTAGYTDKLKISEKCIGCGLCASQCPMKNISIIDGKAVADNKCTMCYRCISRCPKKAITLVGDEVIEQCRFDKYC